jgi:REP element-mobilizing transposase RayT
MPPGVFYRRNLPHWHPEHAALFVTWRLHGSLPADVLTMLRQRKKELKPGKSFHFADRALDAGTSGPLWLKEPRVAQCIVEALHRGAEALGLFELHSFVVMANHVHVLLTPKAPLARITRGLKRHTAATANQILHRSGQRFWQEESFDHWVRDESEFYRIKDYIEQNPVKAGLVAKAEEWPWSSAFRSTRSTGL